jgi:hypothetical protein
VVLNHNDLIHRQHVEAFWIFMLEHWRLVLAAIGQRDAGKHLIVHKTASTTKNYLAQMSKAQRWRNPILGSLSLSLSLSLSPYIYILKGKLNF